MPGLHIAANLQDLAFLRGHLRAQQQFRQLAKIGHRARLIIFVPSHVLPNMGVELFQQCHNVLKQRHAIDRSPVAHRGDGLRADDIPNEAGDLHRGILGHT